MLLGSRPGQRHRYTSIPLSEIRSRAVLGAQIFRSEAMPMRWPDPTTEICTNDNCNKRIAELEAALREIAKPTYGTEINDTDAERCPRCHGAGVVVVTGRGDPTLEQRMYDANRLVREFTGPVPSVEWTAIVRAANEAESMYLASYWSQPRR